MLSLHLSIESLALIVGITPLTGNDDKTAFQFSVNMPEYIPALTRAATDENAVNDLWLMTFDTNGLFIGRAHASLLSSNSNGTGTFQANIPDDARIIHLIANYSQWDSFDERAADVCIRFGKMPADVVEVSPHLASASTVR